MPIEDEAERVRARLEPGEMALQINHPLARIMAHRFDQVEALPGPDERALGDAFAPFGIDQTVGDDAGAETEPRHLLAIAHSERADGDIERCVPIRLDAADR